MAFSRARSFAFAGGLALSMSAFAVACSSSSSTSDAGAGGATCSAPGQPTPGAADTHCSGVPAQSVSEAACHPDAASAAGPSDAGGDAGSVDTCDYGATEFGTEGVDDDCKYKVEWSSDPICEGAAGVIFTVKVTSNVDGSPVTGIPGGINPEVFIPTSPTQACDNKSTHGSPGTANLIETAAGTGVYKGPIVFDAPGQWTLRFHIHEECADLLGESPHGHVAFRVTVP